MASALPTQPQERFWFGPLQESAWDAQLLPALLALGGRPFRRLDQSLWLAADPPVFARWQPITPAQKGPPLLWLHPFDRPLPLIWLNDARPRLGLLAREAPPDGAGLCDRWAALETGQARRLQRAGYAVSEHTWLGHEPLFARSEPKLWQLMVLAQQAPPGRLSERLDSGWEFSLNLLAELRRSRNLGLSADQPFPEVLPLLLLARLSGARVLAEAWPPDLDPQLQALLQPCPAAEFEAACTLPDETACPDPAAWDYRRRLAPLIAELPGLSAGARSGVSLPAARPVLPAPTLPDNLPQLLHHRQGCQELAEILSRRLNRRQPEHIWWEGPQAEVQSLALINTILSTTLAQRLPTAQIQLLPTAPTPTVARLPEALPQLLISHRFPPRLKLPAALQAQNVAWACILPWEYGAIPRDWLALRRCHALWVPSAAVRSAFWQAGFDWQRVQVLPNGVDTSLFHPHGPRRPLATRASFRFLFVGGCLARKGVDRLVMAFRQAFDPSENVCLVIKDAGRTGAYALEPTRRAVLAACEAAGAEIHYLDDESLSPAELAELYRACDVYVHPYRGEGFGLPMLEAMACGLPVILTDSGPGPEFCPPEASWQVRSLPDFEPGLAGGEDGLCGCPWWHEPDQAELIRLLRLARQHAERAEKGRAARRAALAYDWQTIADRYAGQIVPLLAPKPAEPIRAQALEWTIPGVPVPNGVSPLPVIPAWQPTAAPALWWLDRLPRPEDALPPEALWLAADPAIAEALCRQGVAADRIGCLPMPWEFQRPPLGLPDSPRVLACCLNLELEALDLLLQAWAAAFDADAPQSLSLLCRESRADKLLETLEQRLDVLKIEACAGLEIQPLPSLAPPRELLAAARLCLLLENPPPLGWILTAQDVGCRLIGPARLQMLERPWSLSLGNDILPQLVWLLRQVFADPQAEARRLLRIQQEQARRHHPRQTRLQLPACLGSLT